MCYLYSITTNQGAIGALFRVVNRDVGNLAPIVRNGQNGRELSTARWGYALITAPLMGGEEARC